nr:hypothetical protein [Tanacetum cinerariifolium]
KVAQALEITKLKKRVKKLERVNKVAGDEQLPERQAEIYQIDMDHAAKVLSMQEDEPEVQEVVDVVTTAKLITEKKKMSGYQGSKRGIFCKMPAETKSKDKNKGKMVKEPKPMKKKQQNTIGFKLDYFKGMSYDDIRLNFEAKFNSNIEFLLKSKKQIEEEENRAIESINETPAQKLAKRRKMNEDVEDLKQHLEIVPDKDDDVYIEATPLARKVPVVDYEIVHLNNKPRYKIIRADGTHQLYVSFITLLKNFDREDLESLWSIVKERFSTSKPNNFFDDYLLTTLRAMFGRPDGQDQV